RIAPDFDLAAADFEKIEEAFGKRIGRAAGGKGAKIKAAVPREPAGDVTPWVFVAQIHFQQRGRAQAQGLAVAIREIGARLLVEHECVLEFRSSDAITDARGDIAKVEALCGGVGRSKQAFRGTTQVSGADKVRAGASGPHFDENNPGTRRNGSKKNGFLRRIEFDEAVERKHVGRIHSISSFRLARARFLRAKHLGGSAPAHEDIAVFVALAPSAKNRDRP